MRSLIGRLRNIMVTALNDNVKLPKYIILVIEDDIIRCVNFDKPGVSTVFRIGLKWLADELHDLVINGKKVLPHKAKKFAYPQIFWVTIEQHHRFSNNMIRHKFNQSLETVVNLHPEMKVLKIR